ncbi:MAG: TetR/AcrR family transcriptional regulator [Spirochaetes bacterium]|nr:TetR/AcrR family transcriptional regulator [Spirochaetota bacterium]HPA73147.1 TetR/AcrR family transcriptional regulator [Spirochaetota bacterium]
MKGELRKKQILECAKKIFSEKGYYDTQVDDIVKMVHIGKGTIYQYFRNKEDVFRALLDSFAQEWEKYSKIYLRDITDGPPYACYHMNFLNERISKTMMFFKADPERCNIILRMGPGVNIQFDPILQRFESRIVNIIIGDIEQGQRIGSIALNVDKQLMANGILGAVYRMAHSLFVQDKDKYAGTDFDDQLRQIILVISNGIFFKEL